LSSSPRLPLPAFDFRAAARPLPMRSWAAPVAGLAVSPWWAAVVYASGIRLGPWPPAGGALALCRDSCSPPACLHEDGLSEYRDGFGGGKTREKKAGDHARQAASAPTAPQALCLSLLIRWSLLVATGQSRQSVLLALIAAHAAFRRGPASAPSLHLARRPARKWTACRPVAGHRLGANRGFSAQCSAPSRC